MRAGSNSLCPGVVSHRRFEPHDHRFDYPVAMVWVDPDHPTPLRVRSADYGDGTSRSLSEQVRVDLTDVLGYRPEGPVRMLSQTRRWGWLFNPITVFLVWHTDPNNPVGAVLEVTNTPWKERHRYGLALASPSDGSGTMDADFAKVLHVSPFLDEDFRYRLRIEVDDPQLVVAIDAVRPDDVTVVATRLQVTRTRPTAANRLRAIRANPFPTHRVSLGIHRQAIALWRKKIPFVPHPSTSTGTPR